jgi:hypothetical protein
MSGEILSQNPEFNSTEKIVLGQDFNLFKEFIPRNPNVFPNVKLSRLSTPREMDLGNTVVQVQSSATPYLGIKEYGVGADLFLGDARSAELHRPELMIKFKDRVPVGLLTRLRFELKTSDGSSFFNEPKIIHWLLGRQSLPLNLFIPTNSNYPGLNYFSDNYDPQNIKRLYVPNSELQNLRGRFWLEDKQVNFLEDFNDQESMAQLKNWLKKTGRSTNY